MANTEIRNEGRHAYLDGDMPTDNPYLDSSEASREWDHGFWAAHNEAAEAAEIAAHEASIEEAYGNFEAAADFWDDDPSPYSGTYSEE